MPFKIVESATCDVCGDVFKGKNPSYALWVHQQKSKVPCSLKRDLKEMNAFKSNLTLEVFREHKRLKTQASEYIQLKKNMERIEVEVGRLREEHGEEVKEKRALHLTIVHLSPVILEYGSTLNPIQELDTIDLKEERFNEIQALKYPHPAYGLVCRQNVPTFLRKVELLQAILPISVQDGHGRAFYKDRNVLKMDDGRVCMSLLQAFCRNEDQEAEDTLLRLRRTDPDSEDFRAQVRKSISDVHLSAGRR